jgi:hypothetical protein
MCINKSNSKRCENKQKTGLDYCGIHKKCKKPVEQLQREPVQREPVQREPVQRQILQRQILQRQILQREPVQKQREPIQRQPIQREPVQKQREPLERQEICLCTNKTANKRCVNRAKPGLEFCGVHRNCSKFWN